MRISKVTGIKMYLWPILSVFKFPITLWIFKIFVCLTQGSNNAWKLMICPLHLFVFWGFCLFVLSLKGVYISCISLDFHMEFQTCISFSNFCWPQCILLCHNKTLKSFLIYKFPLCSFFLAKRLLKKLHYFYYSISHNMDLADCFPVVVFNMCSALCVSCKSVIGSRGGIRFMCDFLFCFGHN